MEVLMQAMGIIHLNGDMGSPSGALGPGREKMRGKYAF
jgi:hypothetical protein